MTQSYCLAAVLSAATVLGATAASAAPISIKNFSFEEDPIATFATMEITGWTRSGAGQSGLVNVTAAFTGTYADDLPDGNQSGFSNNPDLIQTLGAVAQIGTYTLSVAIGNRPGNSLPDHTINLFAGTSLIASASGDGTYVFPNPNDGVERWEDMVASGTVSAGFAGLGDFLRIELVNEGTGGFGGGEQVGWDNVRLDFQAAAPVPLPAGLPALLSGLAAFAWMRRRAR